MHRSLNRTSPIEKYHYTWDRVLEINRLCFGITDWNDLRISADFQHNDNDIGIHTILKRREKAPSGGLVTASREIFEEISPPLNDEQLPAFIRGMETMCDVLIEDGILPEPGNSNKSVLEQLSQLNI